MNDMWCTANTERPAKFQPPTAVADIPVSASADGGHPGSGNACALAEYEHGDASVARRAGLRAHVRAGDVRHGCAGARGSQVRVRVHVRVAGLGVTIPRSPLVLLR
jgi:hypothetical protein